MGRGKETTSKQIAPDWGFWIYSYDYYDFTFYNLQLWAAAKHRRIHLLTTDRQTFTKTSPPPNNTVPAAFG